MNAPLHQTSVADEAHRFQNALRIMYNLNKRHLVNAGVYEADDPQATVFSEKPMWCACLLDEERMASLFALIESRQPREASTERLTQPGRG